MTDGLLPAVFILLALIGFGFLIATGICEGAFWHTIPHATVVVATPDGHTPFILHTGEVRFHGSKLILLPSRAQFPVSAITSVRITIDPSVAPLE